MYLTLEETLREIAYANGEDPNASLINLIETNKKHLFDFNYPITTLEWKNIFEELFCEEFITNTLSYPIEDLDLWKLKLRGWLNLNMPYYIQLLESEEWFDKYITNPANNTDYKETYTRKYNGTVGTNISANMTNEEDALSNSENKTIINNNSTNEIKTETDTTAESITSSGTNSDTTTGTKNTSSQLPKTQYDFGESYANETSNIKATQETATNTNTNDNSSNNTALTSNETNKSESINNGNITLKNNSNSNSNSNTDSNTTTDNEETYEFRRYGNIGVQTPGEVFTNTRKAFINTTKDILKDKELKRLFLLVY